MGYVLVLRNVGKDVGIMPGQIKQTTRIRDHLDKLLQNTQPGTIVYTSKVSESLKKNCRNIQVRNVGLAMRERSDVELVENGVWRKK